MKKITADGHEKHFVVMEMFCWLVGIVVILVYMHLSKSVHTLNALYVNYTLIKVIFKVKKRFKSNPKIESSTNKIHLLYLINNIVIQRIISYF